MVITQLVGSDQTSFMLSRYDQINLRRLFVNLQLTHNSGKRMIASLDTKKPLIELNECTFFHYCQNVIGTISLW